MDDKAFIQKLEAKIKERIPGFEVRYKDEYASQRFLGFLLKWVIPFNRVYMTNYTTTLYPRVYFPSRKWAEENPRRVWKVLSHEYVHLWDQKQSPAWYPTSYALPQLAAGAALAAFGAFWSLWFLLALGFLIFALPWPSSGRTRAEMRGYGMSMAVNRWRYGSVSDRQKADVAQQFLGWAYYRMCASKRKVEERINRNIEAMKSGAIFIGDPGRPFQDVHDLLKDEGELYSA